METSKSPDRATRAAIIAWGIIGWLILASAAFWLLGSIMPAIVPFLMGGVIILVLRAPVNLLEARGMPRAWAVAACYVLMFTGIAVFSSFVIPAIVTQLQQFTQEFPSYYRMAEQWWNGLQGQAETVVLPVWVHNGVSDAVATISSNLTSWASTAAGGVLSAGQSAATLLIDFVLAFVIGFWALKDLPKVRVELMALIGEHRRGEADMILETVLRVLGGYVRGQLMISAVTGVLVWIGLAIVGVPYALVLGLSTGILNVVPYLGPFVGALIAGIVGLFVSPMTGLLAVVVILAAQQLTDVFVTPRVMSSQVDLHPLLVIFSLLLGGTLFGFWGLILAIPIAAIGKGLFVYYYERSTNRVISTEDGVLFKSKCAEATPECSDTDAIDEETQA